MATTPSTTVPQVAPITAPAPIPVPKFRGIVKSVNSGDTLLIQEVDPKNSGPPAERQLTLSSLSAPHFGRPKTEDKEAIPDEPFAWESREFLRKKAIGKKILFSIDNVHPNTGREYGTVLLVDTNENLNSLIVSEGWATVHKPMGREIKRPDLIALLQFEEAAQTVGKGIHNPNKKEALVKPPPINDIFKFYDKLKGKSLNAIVEQVRSASTLRLTLLPTLQNIIVLLSGAQSPGWKRTDDRTQEPEPFAREAKFFTEQGVLQREVQVQLDGVDKQGNLYATVEFGAIDVAEHLLKNGLATYVQWSAALRGQTWATKLKEAEQQAKDGHKRIFSNYVESAEGAASGTPKNFDGKVVAILNTLAICVSVGGQEQQVTLSSVRVPRPPFPGDQEEENNLPADQKLAFRSERGWALEAREFLRKRLIGQKVKAVFDYARKTGPRKEGIEAPSSAEKSFYSVYIGNVNIAVLLVEQGLAKVVEHKAGEDRSKEYDLLVLAENKAKSANKGWHGPPEAAPTRRPNDLTVDGNDPKVRSAQISKAKQMLPHLMKNKIHSAIVDHVFSGARYKVYIPKESCTLSLSLAGIKVPKRGEGNPEMDEISNLALNFAREKINQREVQVEIDSIDKGGNFVGQLSIGGRSHNFAFQLLAEGYATIHRPSAERMPQLKDFITYEDQAKAKRKHLWKNYDAAEEKRLAKAALDLLNNNNNNNALPSTGQEYFDVFVTEVIDGTQFYIQVLNETSSSLDDLVASLTELSVSEGAIPPLQAPRGELVRAQFTEDDQWYRAKVLNVSGDEYKVLYIDFGNTEILPASRLRALPANYRSLAPQAKEAALAFLKAPKLESDWGRDSQGLLRELTNGKKLMASVEYKDEGVVYLTLGDAESGVHINASMLRAGLARVDRRRRRFLSLPVVTKLIEEEEKARSSHVGIWQYGDAPDSDEDEDEPRSRGKAPAKAPKDATAKAPAKK